MKERESVSGILILVSFFFLKSINGKSKEEIYICRQVSNYKINIIKQPESLDPKTLQRGATTELLFSKKKPKTNKYVKQKTKQLYGYRDSNKNQPPKNKIFKESR